MSLIGTVVKSTKLQCHRNDGKIRRDCAAAAVVDVATAANRSSDSFRVTSDVARVGRVGEGVTMMLRGSSATVEFQIYSVYFLARDVIYTSRAYATMSVFVYLSVCL